MLAASSMPSTLCPAWIGPYDDRERALQHVSLLRVVCARSSASWPLRVVAAVRPLVDRERALKHVEASSVVAQVRVSDMIPSATSSQRAGHFRVVAAVRPLLDRERALQHVALLLRRTRPDSLKAPYAAAVASREMFAPSAPKSCRGLDIAAFRAAVRRSLIARARA